MDTRPIGVFDSGIGGLTVLKELEETFKEENFIYLGDTLNFPYGDKTKEEIISFSKSNIEYLISKNVKMIIIACGTATSQSLDEMRELFDIPIMGIIEPTVQYVKNMSIRKIGVIATTGTIRSGAWEKSLKKQISDIEVVSNACPLLAGIAEEGKATSKESIEAVHNYMEIFKQNHIDTIILAVAQNVKKYLSENKIQNKGVKNPPKIILSKKETDFDQKAKNILKSAKKLDITNFY